MVALFLFVLGGGSTSPSKPNIAVLVSLSQINGSATDLIGATITITDDDTSEVLFTSTWEGAAVKTYIPVFTNFTISTSSVEGYKNFSNSYYADEFIKEIIVYYYGYGIYIEDTNHKLYTSSQWSSQGKTANSIVCITPQHSFRAALDRMDSTKRAIHSANTDAIKNYITVYSYTPTPQYIEDWDGQGNTQKIINFNTAYGTNTMEYAAPAAASFLFPDGTTKGYLPSVQEMWFIFQNLTTVNTCLSKCGGHQFVFDHGSDYGCYVCSTIGTGYYYTSAPAPVITAASNWGNVNTAFSDMVTQYTIRPFGLL